jgi:two-component system response regulator HydG
VLVHGETGTGKELIARRIHEAGSRSNGPFVAINCAAVLPSLLESELFGHARGAFTDAKHERKGLFVQADQGTLFLDEVAEMPLDMQAKLLRALQERRVRPVGANVEVAFDVRLVTATNRDLEALVRQRLFREDLFYRIDVARIRVPPLRERSADVLELAHYFLGRYAARVGRPPLGISSEAAKRLSAYTWPGNVRELENCIERALAFARGDEIGVDDLPENVEVRARENEEIVTLAEVEKQYVSHALGVLGNNKTLAAELLGVDRRTLSRKIARWKNGQRASSPSQPSGVVNVPDAESE